MWPLWTSVRTGVEEANILFAVTYSPDKEDPKDLPENQRFPSEKEGSEAESGSEKDSRGAGSGPITLRRTQGHIYVSSALRCLPSPSIAASCRHHSCHLPSPQDAQQVPALGLCPQGSPNTSRLTPIQDST
ncbi:hypothetical protein P7K49_005884 [Saguinus oedipus]|uniref:Uncharacterized protein n=1 Tax=Saguinus oedipus TaxID=9490 RepID=A0ABQ9W0V0_SAGOE|nr:hypothetical protein P7K49_005884 [Saguinus oedipus]